MDFRIWVVGCIGGIALLAAWVWLAWAWMSKVKVGDRFFTPEQLFSLDTMRAAGADDGFLCLMQTLVDLSNAGRAGLVRALLDRFWRGKQEVVMRAAYDRTEQSPGDSDSTPCLFDVAVEFYGLDEQALEEIEAKEAARRADIRARWKKKIPDVDV